MVRKKEKKSRWKAKYAYTEWGRDGNEIERDACWLDIKRQWAKDWKTDRDRNVQELQYNQIL